MFYFWFGYMLHVLSVIPEHRDTVHIHMLTCVTRLSSQVSRMSTVAAVAQMTVTSDIEHNLEQAGRLVAEARARGAAMVFLPEACDYIGETRQQSLALASSIHTGDTVARFREELTIHSARDT